MYVCMCTGLHVTTVLVRWKKDQALLQVNLASQQWGSSRFKPGGQVNKVYSQDQSWQTAQARARERKLSIKTALKWSLGESCLSKLFFMQCYYPRPFSSSMWILASKPAKPLKAQVLMRAREVPPCCVMGWGMKQRRSHQGIQQGGLQCARAGWGGAWGLQNMPTQRTLNSTDLPKHLVLLVPVAVRNKDKDMGDIWPFRESNVLYTLSR